MTNNRQEKTKNLSFCPKFSLKWIVLQNSFMLAYSTLSKFLGDLVTFGQHSITYSTKNNKANWLKSIYECLARPKPWKTFFFSSRIVTQRLHLSYECTLGYNSLVFKWKILAVSLNRTLFELEIFEMRDKWCAMLK